MFREVPILATFFLLLILSVIYIGIDGALSYPKYDSGIIIDKHYVAESNSTGTGVGMTSNGKMGVVVTSNHESEKYLLTVKTNKGEIVTVKCEPKLFYRKKLNENLDFRIQTGCFSKSNWGAYGIKK
ncbi:hypothetical protein FLJC2902T_17340 [Flavobacterium limnosediminis JC2902]|uniref:Uncharacterized protein n=1 Tax=Flavobacterium limnosediminis JC2902 TaxID=1341181 RepID=V6SP31_9FLAO|nr:hypothetical protein [Flavobacterium limnosediminis]ESU28381.1 hypothetical protein FLJC2902T_17340 [Flavobacterium limnosediminis JC2902]